MLDDELVAVCEKLREALALRDKYRSEVELDTFQRPEVVSEVTEEPYDPFEAPPWAGKAFSFQQRYGTMNVWAECEMARAGLLRDAESPKDARAPAFTPPPSLSDYAKDLARLVAITSDPAVNSFCYGRLQMLEARFQLHKMDHEELEAAEQRAVPHRDFYNVRKVDTHVHLAAAMNQKHLLRFIKRKAKFHAGDVVARKGGGAPQTLAEVFDEMGLSERDLSIDALGMNADADTFARFDKFNLKYNPLGKSKLREIFIKTDNPSHGRYFAEITQELFDDLAFSKYQKAEYRISVYGRKPAEWDQLADWVVDHRLYSPHNRWLIQVPRLYATRPRALAPRPLARGPEARPKPPSP